MPLTMLDGFVMNILLTDTGKPKAFAASPPSKSRLSTFEGCLDQ
jgi:hypothetical protein